MSADSRIYLWDAGPASGTAGTAEGAREAAAAYLGGRDEVTVHEARVDLMPLEGPASEHQRTGLAWRGTLVGGQPSWSQVAERAADALGGVPPFG